ncbi:MAG: hypothetical protein ABEJ57_07315 [Halobacteriaceae archaeon]
MRRRAQSNLIAVVVALVLVTAAIGVALAVAGTPFRGDRVSPVDRRVAADVASTLLAADSPVTRRHLVLNRSALASLDAATVRALTGLPDEIGVTVAFEGRSLIEAGTGNEGATVRRVVTVTTWTWERSTPAFANTSALTLSPAPRVRIGFNTSATTIETVRVDGRVVLHDPDGLTGQVTLRLPRTESVNISFTATGELDEGAVWIAVPTVETETGVLAVTVDG